MLRRLKIGGRVNLLIAVPLLALIALAAMGFVALQRASVRGDGYKAVKQAEDLRADVVPPPASLLSAWSEVNFVGVLAASPDGNTPAVQAEINRHLNNIDRRNFDAAMAHWSAQQLDQRVYIRLVDMGGDAGVKFFNAVDTELKPAIAAGKPEQVLSVIRSLEWRYDLQQTGVQRALVWADGQVTTREASADSYVSKVLLIVGIATGLLVLATLLLSVRVRRSIVRPIRALAARAKAVATHELPDVVDSVQHLPADSALPRLPAFETDTSDELSELAKSLTSVQDVAVDLAGEQALARRTVSENLVNIARRNQTLLGRTLGFISSLEQGERDPEALDNLFRLDHLTTRMRRNAQSLLVLAGAEQTRLWSPAVQIGDVVRAALSEVENYGQVELADLGDVTVQGAIAGEVAHLLAELLENATSFSPPNSPVTVVGRTVPDGHQLAIFDYGLGMRAQELAEANRRLNQVSSFDRETNKMLGFQVVARLAARYDIKVMLTTTPGGTGVTAIVRLPQSVLEVPTSPNEESPVVDLPMVTEHLSAPLPFVTPAPLATVTVDSLASEMSDDALWASMHSASVNDEVPVVAPVPPLVPLTSLAPLPEHAALTGFVAPDELPVVAVADEPELASPGAPGLAKRVRGAQMPDVGTAQLEPGIVRPADEVRATLASLQRGIDLGRQRGNES